MAVVFLITPFPVSLVALISLISVALQTATLSIIYGLSKKLQGGGLAENAVVVADAVVVANKA